MPDTRITPERRRQVRRERDLTKIKITLAAGLTFVAAASFTIGALWGSGKLEDLNKRLASSRAISEARK